MSDALIVQRYGQSTYAPSGEPSREQREAWNRELLDILVRAATAAGRWEVLEELGIEPAVDWRRAARQLRTDAWLARIEHSAKAEAGLEGTRSEPA